ncbi:hypothetical protein ACFLTH_12125 [Bacteroidota bacterium]
MIQIEPDVSVIVPLLTALGGIILGFSLNVIKDYIKDRQVQKKFKRALLDELEGNYFQLEDKKNTIQNMLSKLKKKEILSGASVKRISVVYDNHYHEIINEFNEIVRDNIHNIYSKLLIIDEFMNHFEDRIIYEIERGAISEPISVYISRLDDMLEQCKVVQKLIVNILNQKSLDIYGRKLKVPFEKRKYLGIINSAAIDEIQ